MSVSAVGSMKSGGSGFSTVGEELEGFKEVVVFNHSSCCIGSMQ